MKLVSITGLMLASIALLPPTRAVASDPSAQCPLANEPYSSRTVLLDLLLDPATHAVLERLAPTILKPPFGAESWSTQPPTFAAILTPDALLQMQKADTATIAALDEALAEVPLTLDAIHARCARYDTVPPSLPAEIRRPAILVFDKSTGFRDVPSVNAAAEALAGMAARRGWTLVSTGNAAVFNDADLTRFDAVVWNNVSGDVLTLPQRESFRRWVEHGGGFAGMHGSGGDPVYFWDWYADTAIGARFIGHPMSPQFQQARVVVEDRSSPIMAGLGEGWTMLEEWYSFKTSPRTRGVHVLARLDESTYSPVGMGGSDIRMGDHPIAWTQCIGDGRSFYTAIGHRPESYVEPNSVALLERGIEWAAGLGASGCKAGHGVPRATEHGHEPG